MTLTPPSLIPRRTWRCPDEARLAAYFERRPPASQLQEVEAHVSSCEHCLAQVAFLLEVQDGELPEVPRALLQRVRQPANSAAPFAPHWKWASAAAALAAVVVVASVLIWRGQPAPIAPPHNIAQREPAPQVAVVTPAPPLHTEPAKGSPAGQARGMTPLSQEPRVLEPKQDATVDSAHLDLRWDAIPRALFYEVIITDPSGRRVWSNKVEQEQAHVPTEAGVKPGQYFVWVRAHLPEGKVIRTQAVTFTVQQ